jgi:uncharacterized repeat protein (TIGR03899 family)
MDNPILGLLKLIDYGASGIGSVAGPMLAPWRARREARATLIDAEAETDSLKILAQGRATALQIISNAQAEARSTLADQNSTIDGEINIQEAISQRIVYQEEKRQSNIVAVLNEAAESLGDKTVEDHEPDHDWTARFFNEVQDVSSDDMRTIWAKILAGEVEKPGSTSARTLTILKNLDRKSARLFNTLCSICVSLRPDANVALDARVPSMGGQPGQNSLQKYGLSYDSLNMLNEYGLIIPDYNSYYPYTIPIGITVGVSGQERIRIPFTFQKRFWVLEPMPEFRQAAEFRLSGVKLTQAGRELQSVVAVEPNHQFLEDLNEFFKKNSLQMTEVSSGAPYASQIG